MKGVGTTPIRCLDKEVTHIFHLYCWVIPCQEVCTNLELSPPFQIPMLFIPVVGNDVAGLHQNFQLNMSICSRDMGHQNMTKI